MTVYYRYYYFDPTYAYMYAGGWQYDSQYGDWYRYNIYGRAERDRDIINAAKNRLAEGMRQI